MRRQKNIKFDWAIKRLLRNKANFRILEGFLSELLREDVVILNIGESEGNQDSVEDKFNRVDIMVENTRDEIFLIELQNSSEADYFMRMLYGVSRAITNHIQQGSDYSNVRKVYSINIVYFEIGHGSDYVYRGINEFRGIHHDDLLQLSTKQKAYFGKDAISHLYTEYYIIKVNGFNDVAKDTLDEWIYYLKNDVILDEFKAKGLPEARKILRIDALSKQERAAYDHHIDMLLLEKNAISDSKNEGRAEGLAEGRAEGEAERKALEAALEKEKAEREALESEIAKLRRLYDKL
ncbi:MAG: Rpn family recombination-promoting nuclease/putative transposase [Prevotellaceae bacterium]|jgi:predicted transposase/invertase (TIGR01784 family)|nr:Rpn family recombination-promoting nuclease/putative transposase [Prevotellaceae bacterium]